MKWLLGPLRRAFDFGGRSDRVEFWMFTLILAMVLVVLEAIEIMLWGLPVLSLLLSLLFFFPGLAVTVRRLHDMGRSGWWVLLYFTIIGAIVPLVFCLAGSDPDVNEYGPNPKLREDNRRKRRDSRTIQYPAVAAQAGVKPKRAGEFKVCGACGTRQNPGTRYCSECGSAQL